MSVANVKIAATLELRASQIKRNVIADLACVWPGVME